MLGTGTAHLIKFNKISSDVPPENPYVGKKIESF